MKIAALALAVALAAACATTSSPAAISETRMTFHPAREPGCSLEFVQSDMMKMRPGGEWEVVGYVNLSDVGAADPLSDKYKDLVRPRACAMGGEMVTIMLANTNQTAYGTGSGTVYGILRHATESPASQKF